jgi:hypothetical protein
MMGEYEAYVRDDFPMRGVRLLIGRPVPSGTEVLFRDGSWKVVGYDEALPDDAGVPMPVGAWEAVRDYVTPGVTVGEVVRLTEALSVERARVDRVLDSLKPPASGPLEMIVRD